MQMTQIQTLVRADQAAGTSIEEILHSALGLAALPSGDREDLHYIERSQALERGIVQYIKTPLLYDACAFFGRANIRARAFTILREPVSRLISLFWYKKDSTWEKDYDAKYRNQSITEFVEAAEENWLMYALCSDLSVGHAWSPHQVYQLMYLYLTYMFFQVYARLYYCAKGRWQGNWRRNI